MRILFMGTPDFAMESLKCLYEEKHNIIGVVTNPDKPKGRGMKTLASPVKEYALEKGLKMYQPERVRKNEEFINEIKSLNPDLIVVVAYGKILPKEILDIPKLGCINVHASLLPKYRGAAPIQWAVINGDKVTGVTTMYMDIGMDTGDMILVRGLNPIMGAYTFLNEKKIKFWKVKAISENDLINIFPELEEYSFKIKELEAGTVMFSSDKKGLYIKANEGIISVLEIQGENARKMPICDFLRGNDIMVGEMFE